MQFLTYSKIWNLTLEAMSNGVNVLSLNMRSFRASYNFPQMHFGIICQALHQPMFFPLDSKILSFQEVNRVKTLIPEGESIFISFKTNFHIV